MERGYIRVQDPDGTPRVTPVVARTFPLADFAAAMRAKWNAEDVGGVVLHP